MVKALNKASDVLLYIGIVLWIITSDSLIPVLTVASVLIHEAGHIIAAILIGNRFRQISLQTGGLKLTGNSIFTSYADEALVAFGGPFFNILSGIIFWSASSESAKHFQQISLAFALLNLMPIKGFDGGMISECLLSLLLPCKLCSKLCDVLSFLSLFFLWSLSVYLLLRTGRYLTLFYFSAAIFVRICRENSHFRICEIIRE